MYENKLFKTYFTFSIKAKDENKLYFTFKCSKDMVIGKEQAKQSMEQVFGSNKER